LLQIQIYTNIHLESALNQQIGVFQRELEACLEKIKRIGELRDDFERMRQVLEKEVNNVSLIYN